MNPPSDQPVSPLPVSPLPVSPLQDVILGLLTPLMLVGDRTDTAMARAAASQAVAAYPDPQDGCLVTIAQIIAFALVALDSLRLSVAPLLSPSMQLRLRGNASTLSRAARDSGKALDQMRQAAVWRTAIAEDPGPQPWQPRAAQPDAFPPELSALSPDSQQRTGQQPTGQKTAGHQPPAVATPAEVRTGRGIPEATPDTAPPDTAPPDTAPPDTAPPDTAPPDTAPLGTLPPDTAPPVAPAAIPAGTIAAQNRLLWADAMQKAATELRASADIVSPARRQTDGLWIEALTMIAAELRQPGQCPPPAGLRKSDLLRTTLMTSGTGFPAHLLNQPPRRRQRSQG